jgi:glutathione peroxidase
MAKCEVNGEGEEPLWTYLKSTIPAPSDDRGGTGSDFIYQIQPNSMPIQWSPVRRSDITWNFEKFLINQDGKPVKRYSPKFENANIVADIEALLKDPDASM